VADQLGLFGDIDEPVEIRIRDVTAYQIIMSAAGREFYITCHGSESRARQHAAECQARHPKSRYFVREVTRGKAG
jgi:hypothetical protein